ncbi:kinase [Paracoccus limosus]|uniref:Kinase n=1 Tax=Paracoccus limosus TaxID=913252 RepID=A0A844H995_9RHOB|nr:PfkB family carbohydrate kinase [Paracoccus limosus]MTH35038.1 kinase [Paracoccus limosus]
MPSQPHLPRILCVGAMLWDIIGHAARAVSPGEDLAGRIVQRPGGVALNVALALARQGLQPAILAAVGRDAPGEALLAEAARLGVRTEWIWRDSGRATDTYMAIETPEGLLAAIADAQGLEAAGAAVVAPLRDGRLGSAARPWVGTLIADGNLTPAVFAELAADPCLAGAQLRLVPASPTKAQSLQPLLRHPQAIFHLNRLEAEALAGRPLADAAEAAGALLHMGVHRALVTDGPRAVADGLAGASLLLRAPPPVVARRVTGAGDAFLAGHVMAELAGHDRAAALDAALNAAAAHVAEAPAEAI